MQEKEFEIFYKKWFKIANHSAANFIYNEDDAAEITQDVFVGVWNNWGNLENESAASAYLMKGIKNRCINFKQKHVRYYSTDFSEIEIAYNLCEINALVIEQVYKKIVDHINTLHPQRKKIMQLILSGMDGVDVAKKLGIAKKTVQNVKHRCMPEIKKIIGFE